MGEQVFLERFVWFDQQARQGSYPNATRLAVQFEISNKTAQRSVEYFRDRLVAPLEFDPTKKGYFYTDLSFQLPMLRISEEKLIRGSVPRPRSRLCPLTNTSLCRPRAYRKHT